MKKVSRKYFLVNSEIFIKINWLIVSILQLISLIKKKVYVEYNNVTINITKRTLLYPSLLFKKSVKNLDKNKIMSTDIIHSSILVFLSIFIFNLCNVL